MTTAPDPDDWYRTEGAKNARAANDRIKAREAARDANRDPATEAAFEKAVAEAAMGYAFDGDPEPLMPAVDLPPWPVHVLPGWIADHVTATSDRLQVPPDLCAQLAVGVLASIGMGHVTVRLDDWSEPVNLYLFAAMHSGAGKSPAEKAMVGPVREWERTRRIDQADSFNVERAIWKVTQKKLRKAEEGYAAGSIGIGEYEEAVLEAAKPEPVEFRLTVDDATPERLTQLVAAHQQLALISTEAGLLDMVAGAYSGGRQPNVDIYLKAWAGETLQRDRKGGDAGPELTVAENALLSVVLTIQPSVVEKYQTTAPELRGRGFFARFMPSVPRSLVGTRTYGQRTRAGAEAEVYRTQVQAMASLYGGGKTIDYHLDDDAAKTFWTWCEDMEAELGPGGRLEALHDAASKIRSSTMRLAALFAMADEAAVLTAEHVHRAIEVGDYWVAHALAVEGITDDVRADEYAAAVMARSIIEWARRHRRDTFTPRDVYASMKRRLRSVEDLAPAFQLLWVRGWVWFEEGSVSDIGVRRVPVMARLHPKALTASVWDITHSGQTGTLTGTPIGHEKSSSSSIYTHIEGGGAVVPVVPVSEADEPADIGTDWL